MAAIRSEDGRLSFATVLVQADGDAVGQWTSSIAPSMFSHLQWTSVRPTKRSQERVIHVLSLGLYDGVYGLRILFVKCRDKFTVHSTLLVVDHL